MTVTREKIIEAMATAMTHRAGVDVLSAATAALDAIHPLAAVVPLHVAPARYDLTQTGNRK
jgi:hypothetical protein